MKVLKLLLLLNVVSSFGSERTDVFTKEYKERLYKKFYALDVTDQTDFIKLLNTRIEHKELNTKVNPYSANEMNGVGKRLDIMQDLSYSLAIKNEKTLKFMTAYSACIRSYPEAMFEILKPLPSKL